MAHTELVLLGLLVAVAALAVLARLVGVPYPILLVLAASARASSPACPTCRWTPSWCC